jgi:hypothetical protein
MFLTEQYKVIQEERSVLWEVILSVIVSTFSIVNGYRDIAVEIKKLQVIYITILNVKNKTNYCQIYNVSTHRQFTVSF